MKSFNDISLPEPLQRALSELKFTTPTPIQASAIPIALEGKDLIGCAQTGTGKTAAFAIPIVVHLLNGNDSRALIITPTRELADQVAEVCAKLSRYVKGLNGIALLIGGMSMQRQVRALDRDPKIIVATPGRLNDHLERGNVNIKKVRIVVMDEADRMLDMGFAPQIEEIFSQVPKERQTLLFSATLPKNIMKLVGQYMNNPERVSTGEVEKPVSRIVQKHLEMSGSEKKDRLISELKNRQGLVLVFARTKMRTDRLAKNLRASQIECVQIHGGRSQSQRMTALDVFRRGETRIMIATDVAARGLDIPAISHVINFDLPQTSEDYIHRIGRTARAGAEGEALSFVTPEEKGFWRSLSLGTKDGESAKNPNHRGGGSNQSGKKHFRGSNRPSGNSHRSDDRNPSFGGGPKKKRFGGGSARFRKGPKSHATGGGFGDKPKKAAGGRGFFAS
ncbi:MAG: DEAD/DEAH box helicase [Deltaproteobacteria bacterium]|nr:DEAD/DEAH box helicase [Deltaproteobacteria bacterium]